MSWKELLLICLIVCAVLIAFVARHFLGDLVFVADHIIATSFVHAPVLLHSAAAFWR